MIFMMMNPTCSEKVCSISSNVVFSINFVVKMKVHNKQDGFAGG